MKLMTSKNTPKRYQHFWSVIFLELKRRKRERELLTKMQISVHVGVGERCHVLLAVFLFEGERGVICGRVRLIQIDALELFDHLHLNFLEMFQSGLTFRGHCFNHFLIFA